MAKRFVLIGGSYGIGNELASRLASDGNDVSVLSRTAGDLANIAGIDHITFDALTDSIPKFDGPVDGLAYLPGTINLRPFHRLTDTDFQNDLNVSLFGAVSAIRSLLPNLKESDSSSVVLFSTVAVKIGMPFHASVAASKGAIEGLTRSLAAEFAPNIRVNCIAPSLTETSLAEKLLNTEQKKELAAERHPMKRVGTVDDIASVAAFLLTGQSSWITGQVIHVDGGMSAIK